MKFTLLISLLLTSCASGYHSYADGKWHDANDYTCPNGWIYESGKCTTIAREVSQAISLQQSAVEKQLPQQQPVIINNILPKIDPIDEDTSKISNKSNSGDDGEDEGNDEEISEEGKKKQIVKLMKEVMLANAKKEIMGQKGNISIGKTGFVGHLELGKANISVGGNHEADTDTFEGLDSNF